MADTRTDRGLEVGAGGATLAALVGAAALIVSVLGLSRRVPLTMLEVATLLVGAGLVIEGSALTAFFARFEETLDRGERTALGGSISAEMLGGVATVVLGVLALLGNQPLVLVPAAAIVAGGSLLVGSGAQEQTRRVLADQRYRRPVQVDVRLEGVSVSTPESRRDERQEELSKAAVSVATAADVLVGLGAVTLGILALLDVNPLVLSLVAMLSLGVAILLGGGAVGARLAQLLHRLG